MFWLGVLAVLVIGGLVVGTAFYFVARYTNLVDSWQMAKSGVLFE